MKFLTNRLIVLIFLSVIVLTSCATSFDITGTPVIHNYGFFGGLWHGVISPISLLGKLLGGQVDMYSSQNVGSLYDLGFMLGLSMLFTGGNLFKKEIN